MKSANVYDIERALQQPITPQQRQTAANNNPIAAIIAQRLDGLEGNLRQKIQTPPPPQGTVMNQYYQWPQQALQYGLAQPGLEELAQQYAAGGLVAFAEGGPTQYGDENNGLFDTDGANGYASGGLATALPMGYAGYDDVPVFNGYAGGGSPLKEVFPYTQFDEEEYEAGEGENFGDVGTGTYGITEQDLAEDRRATDVAQERIDAKRRVAERKDMERYSAAPGDIVGKGVEGVRKLGSALSDMAFIKDPAWEARQAEKKQQADDYYKTTSPPPSGGKQVEQGIAAVPTEPGFADKAKAVVSSIGETLRGSTESGEDRKLKQQTEERSRAVAAKNAQAEQPTKKTALSPAAAQPTPEGPGVSLLSPAAWNAERGAGLAPASYEPSPELPTVVTDGKPDEINLNPNNNATAGAIVSSGLTADQQIAALAKYFQTDISEAMRIKGEMEKDNARAGNVGILSALAGAVGMGLGTYGPGSRRWGAGLMQLASGVMGEQQNAEKRQDKLNDLALKVKEMQGSGTRKAAEMVLNARAKADAERDALRKALLVESVKGKFDIERENRHSDAIENAARTRADAYASRPQSTGQMNEYQQNMLLMKAKELAQKDVLELFANRPPTPQLEAEKNAYYQQRLSMYMSGEAPLSSMTGTATPQGPDRGFFKDGFITPPR